MRLKERRKIALFVLILGISLVALAVALNVGWILLNLQQIALLVLGIVFFALIITGVILNTIFLLREIRRNEQHNAFINAVTHELKTPVASIRLYLETLQARPLDEAKRSEFYAVMLSDTERLSNTIEQVLQVGRTANRRRELSRSNINLNALIADAIATISARYALPAEAVNYEQLTEAALSGDARELQSVFENLLDNAVKYSGATVKINLTLSDTSTGRVRVEITDNGIGIAPGELKRIFRRFYRVAELATQRVKGTGLGLAIVEAVGERHGGKVYAESAGAGRGTTFVVELPKN